MFVPGENDESDFELYGVPPHFPEDPPFPSLKRLHVVFAFAKLHPWEQTLPQWAALAPAVTHLRISQGNARVPRIVRDVLGLPPSLTATQPLPPSAAAHALEGEGQNPFNAEMEPVETSVVQPAYPSVRLVIVQLSLAPKWVSDSTANTVRALEREIGQLATECAEDGRTQAWVSVLRSRLYDPEYWPRRLTWEWQDRMSGGGGCWNEDEDDEDERRGEVVGPLPKRDEPLPLADPGSDSPHRKTPKTKQWWKAVFSRTKRRTD